MLEKVGRFVDHDDRVLSGAVSGLQHRGLFSLRLGQKYQVVCVGSARPLLVRWKGYRRVDVLEIAKNAADKCSFIGRGRLRGRWESRFLYVEVIPRELWLWLCTHRDQQDMFGDVE